jgi:predicted glycosyltransferase
MSAPTLVHYARELFGLGHFSRQLALAEVLDREWPQLRQLIVTGAHAPQYFDVPDAVEVIKLPGLLRTNTYELLARVLPLPGSSVEAMRRDIMHAVVKHLEPDIFLVDVDAFPKDPEVFPVLEALRDRGAQTRFVLGLRDVVFEPERVRKVWEENGTYRRIEALFDLILVYGEQRLFDSATEYGFSPSLTRRTRYTGYLQRNHALRGRAEVRAEFPLRTGRLVVVTVGGGRDGYALERTYLNALGECAASIPFDTLLLSGPFMPVEQRRELAVLAERMPGVHFRTVVRRLPDYLNASDAVISLAGYNTVNEILFLGRPALLVPRVNPQREQLVRAKVLSEQGYVRMLHPDHLTPGRLLDETLALLDPLAPRVPDLVCNGSSNAMTELRALLAGRGNDRGRR